MEEKEDEKYHNVINDYSFVLIDDKFSRPVTVELPPLSLSNET